MWFYSKNGAQLGPVPESEMRNKLASGEISGTDLVWREGMSEWLPAIRVLPPEGANTPVPHSPLPNGKRIPTYLWQSIVVTLFCCLPFGVVGIVYASKVDNLIAAGDIDGAMEASKKAKLWVNLSVGAILLLFVIALIFSFLEESGAI